MYQELLELASILLSVTSKGLMNRAHAYKVAVAENESTLGRDPDQSIILTLYSYPMLMPADNLMFEDQLARTRPGERPRRQRTVRDLPRIRERNLNARRPRAMHPASAGAR